MNAPLSAPYGDQPTQSGYSARSGLMELDVMALVRILRRRLGLVAGTVGLAAVLMAIVVFQLTPLYTSTNLILIDPQRTQVLDMEAVLSGLSPDTGTIDSQVELLRSRTIAHRVVEKLNLVEDPEFNARLTSPSLLDYVNPLKWLRSLVSTKETPSTIEERERLIQSEVIEAFRDSLSVSRRGLTYVIEVAVSSESAAKAARLANEVADTYVLDQLEAKFEATRKANAWLSSRLSDLREALRDSERAAEIFRAENNLIDAGGVTLNDQQLSELNAQLILIRAEKAERLAKFKRVEELLARGAGLESVAEVLQSQVVTDLRQQQAELARKQAELASRYGPRNQKMIDVQAERRDLDRQIEAEVRRIVAGLENSVAEIETRELALKSSLGELQGQAGDDNQAMVRLRELRREADANRTLYESFLHRFKETTEQEGIQTSDARVISQATPAIEPSYPRKTMILGVTIVFAGFFGVGLALLVDRLDNTIHTAAEMEELLDLPHISSIPTVDVETGALGAVPTAPHDYVLAKPLSAYAEALRTLRTALSLSNVDNPPKVIMFTSALPNEGKTTTCLSFARAAAQAGIKTALVDGDLRHPSIHKLLERAQPKVGLVELLAGRASMDEAMMTDEPSGVQILPIASGVANPPDLLGSSQMRKLIKQLHDDYDLVLIDAAPILPVVDSRVLARLADKTVFLVRWNDTPREASINAVKELRSYKADLAGCVLNQVDLGRRAQYGYGDGGAYYGQYSKYYVN